MIYGNLKNHIAVVHEGKGKMRNPKGTNPKKTKERKYKYGQVILIDTHIVPISRFHKSESLLKKLVPDQRLSPFYQNMV